MARNSLLDVFEDFSGLDAPFVVHDDGYRTYQWSYREVGDAARRFAAQLAKAGVNPGDKVVVWSENRPEWLVALWGTLLARAVLVPVDYRASADLLSRVATIVSARLVLTGDEVHVPSTLATPTQPIGTLGRAGLAPAGAREESASGTTDTATIGQASDGPSVAEIIFTSGATADPKGVTITHRNILANLVPIEREVAKYRRYERLVHPIRFLNLLPLSHMFGQSMATFVPPAIGGTVVFSQRYGPADIARLIRERRVSVLVCVPKILRVLHDFIVREFPETAEPDVLAGRHFLWRWWRYRRVHRWFGWKFWCIVCGAAPLDPELERFWRRLGFLVVQGYGLTETAPIVTLNHPFRSSQGTVGKPIGGVDVRIAPDGEILVRGENVTPGYYVAGGSPSRPGDDAFRDGWFHTGDIGELDAAGRLTIKGRKKDMIVTSQGLNVFPEDVEKALLAEPGVRDAAVLGVVDASGEERVHAVLVVTPGTDVEATVRRANARLEDHQRVRNATVWPGDLLPRTEGTLKLKRHELQRWLTGDASGAGGAPQGTTVASIVGRYAPGREITPEATLEELGLSSLDRVELLVALEQTFQVTLDETAVDARRRIREIEAAMRDEPPATPRAAGLSGVRPTEAASAPIAFPSWNRSWPVRLVRRLSLPTWILPVIGRYLDLSVTGAAHLDGLRQPVLFASNHQSHLDTPAILLALPRRLRYRVAPAMAKEYFAAHFGRANAGWRTRLANSASYYLACAFFNAFPLPQREAGTRQTVRYIGTVLAGGDSVLIFPEGRRTSTEAIGRFLPGVGMLGSRLQVPVIPVRVEGLDRVMPAGSLRPRRGPVRVAFGAPISLEGQDYAAMALRVESAVRGLDATEN